MAESGGTVGGRYALVERIGSGAMGVVWRARDELLDREVAVKQLRGPDLTSEEAEVAGARAMREARNAARLQHPNAVAVFDVVVENDRPWLVMEYLPSRSLAGLLAEQGRLSPAETARIGGQVAAALAAAHAAGIVHRDVKPSNVLIGHDGAVKLTDFGISRATGDGTLTDSGMITGTPAYLAPEVARGEQPGTASDVFSLGATLYAATEGQAPYGASDNSFGLLYRAAAGRIEPPTGSGELTGLLTRMLATDPETRPTAAQAVELLAKPPVEGKPHVEPVAKPSAERKRRRWLVPAVVAAVMLLVTGVAAAVFLLPELNLNLSRNVSTYPTPVPTPSYTTDQAVELVRSHYEALPENMEVAYENLATSYRQPFPEYQKFWSQYDDVRAGEFEAAQAHRTRFIVRVRVTFVQGPSEVSGLYQLVVEAGDGRLRIAASQPLT
ncbi:serine/threonine-protein kinase [Saccharothrix deserti]|uniref:serine/threonine-protein kinase n=1 Tax=Saccharothrix deserti TaxID=2593674 RepID=UPI001EE498A5|nr:serine/threonine-protein kinase [Saccharothrix deserti]